MTQKPTTKPATPPLPWAKIQTVLLDMDGTLLDLSFDNHFFRQKVPQAYAEKQQLDFDTAQNQVRKAYEKVAGTLAWYDLDHWSRVLELDIPQLKQSEAHRIQPLPGALFTLKTLGTLNRAPHVVTNAHPYSIALKMARTPLRPLLASITSSHDLGKAKEDPEFWPLLQQHLGFKRETTLLVDDSEPVLKAAAAFGIAFLRHQAAPCSNLPPNPSSRFPAIHTLPEILPPNPTAFR